MAEAKISQKVRIAADEFSGYMQMNKARASYYEEEEKRKSEKVQRMAKEAKARFLGK